MPAQLGQEPLGVIRDWRSGSWVAVVPVRGASFALLDPGEQLRRLEGWRAVLGTVARGGTSVRRLQWVQRSWTEGPAWPAPSRLCAPANDAPMSSYCELLAGDGGKTQMHDTWVVIAVGGSGRPGRAQSVDALRREVRLLEGQLRHADLQVGPPLDRDGLAGLMAVAPPTSTSRRRPWAMASDESWSAARMDDGWHATYWISEWPRIEVGPDFLTPLLLAADRRTVALTMAPVAPDRAVRQVRSARTADVADEELRSRAGFLPNARREREAEGVTQREVELADGHAEYRFSGYLTVSATDRAGLATACVQAEQAAQESHLELRRLFGRQAEAYTWTLPLGRGLA